MVGTIFLSKDGPSMPSDALLGLSIRRSFNFHQSGIVVAIIDVSCH